MPVKGMIPMVQKIKYAFASENKNVYFFFLYAYDLSIGSTETKYIKPNTKTQNDIVTFEFFIKSDFVILAFFKKN